MSLGEPPDRIPPPLPSSPRRSAPIPPPGWFDRFGGKLVLVLLDRKLEPSTKGGRSLWGLQRPLTYRPGEPGEEITVPAGFVTDLASIPRWAWVLLPPDGPWVKGAIIHDFLYATGGTGVWKRHPPGITRAQPYSRAEADRILRQAIHNRGVGVIKRNIIWAAVRVGGRAGWGSGEKERPSTAADERFITGRGES